MRKVARPASEPRSYVVQTGVMEYRRNRRHILAVPEPAPAQSPAAASSPTLSGTAPQQPPTLSMLLTGVLPCQIRIYSLSLQFPPRHHQSLESIRRHRQGSLSDAQLHHSLLLKKVRRRSLVQMVPHTVTPKDRKLSQDLGESHDFIRNSRSL